MRTEGTDTDTGDSIADAQVRARYVFATDAIARWLGPRMNLAEAEVLDFGCGDGITALGMIRRKSVRKLLGVDIMPDVDHCAEQARIHLGLETLPENLELQRIAPGQDFAPDRKFDLIYAWSVFEHVEQPLIPAILGLLRNKLREGGYLFVQIAPLYYSADGSHLFHRIPEPWGHLTNQQSVYYAKLCRACESREEIDALWSCYQWLNKTTAPALRRHIEQAGFKVVAAQRIPDANSPPAELLAIYNPQVLTCNQLIMLASPSRDESLAASTIRRLKGLLQW